METKISVRAKFFGGFGVQTLPCIVENNGRVLVWDDVAGYYTSCHRLSLRTQRRIIRRLAQSA